MRKEGLTSRRLDRGFDFLTTIRAEQWIEAPAEFMGPKMQSFREMVTFIGAPLNPPIGNADTVMERLEDVEIGKEVPTRLAAFANVSAAPIHLKGTGRMTGYYDLYVTLSPTLESPGSTIFHSKDGVRGSFESKISLSPLFELRPLGGGESIFVDTGVMPLPGFPMRLGVSQGIWTREPSVKNSVRHFGGRSIFYEGEVMIISEEEAPSGSRLAMCVKRQAQFIAHGEIGSFTRMNFPRPHKTANLGSM